MYFKYEVGDRVRYRYGNKCRTHFTESIIVDRTSDLVENRYYVKGKSNYILEDQIIELVNSTPRVEFRVGDIVEYLNDSAKTTIGTLAQESTISSIKGWVVTPTANSKPVWVSESDIIGVLDDDKSKLKKISRHIDEICKIYLTSTFDDEEHGYIVEDHLIAIKEILDEDS